MGDVMRIVWFSLLCFCLLTASLCYADQKEDWQPITQEDLLTKDVPGDPGAPAIQLYYANFLDDSTQNEFEYRRIKILTEKGKKWADVEIPAGTGLNVRDLKARTIRPDGSIVEFTGKPFEKTIIKGRGIKILVKSFTLPEANVGSIIEYKYKIQFEDSFTTDHWVLQHDLYTVKEDFTFKAYEGALLGSDFELGSRVAWVSLHLKSEQVPTRVKDRGAELHLQKMPAFETEEYMPPENNYKPEVYFFYVSPEVKTADGYWEERGKKWYEGIEHFIGNHKEAKEAALAAIGNETDPEKKLRKLYARAQEIRNLSYERERTDEERKKEKLKENEGVAEIFKRGYGDRGDITVAFAAMARAAGFEASVMPVSSRKDAFFIREVLSSRQMNSQIVDVKLNGNDIYLDPGTRFCPFGLLPWTHTSTQALRLDKKSPTFVMIPAARLDRAVTVRRVNATLDTDGSLKGTVMVQFSWTEALERRLDAQQTDDAGRKKQLEDEFKNWLTAGAIVKLTDVQGWESSEEPLTAHFTIEIPGYASSAGKRLLVPSYLFQVKQKEAFTHPDRKYPVYFPYAFIERDVVTIQFPSGYSLEGTPPVQHVSLPYAEYANTGKIDGNQLITQRELWLNGIFFPQANYAEVRDFFNKVQAGDEQQAVLRVGGATSAQKGN